VILGVLGYLLFWVVAFPGTILFSLLALLAKEATVQPVYVHRVACDLLFLAALGFSVPGFLPLARRLGVAAGPVRGSKRWTAYAAAVAVGSLMIAIVALLGRVNPMLFRRL